jgi:hypothetical protein
MSRCGRCGGGGGGKRGNRFGGTVPGGASHLCMEAKVEGQAKTSLHVLGYRLTCLALHVATGQNSRLGSDEHR